jgi:hypothetical protein
MPEQWELDTNDARSADQITNYIIFCEDEVSEPYYFSSFQVSDVLRINAIPNQKHSKLNLDNTIAHCKSNGLIEFKKDSYQVIEPHNENIWCVYDRDMEHEAFEQIRKSQHVAFDTAIVTANNAGINVAWSNDAFELWILLHFEPVPTENILHRTYFYNRLTEIFRSLHPDSEEYQYIVSNANFNYKSTLKKRSLFIRFVLPVLRANTATAMANAVELENNFNNDTEFHLRNPCTMVHHLVERLLPFQA